jgi:ElaB/YqjD/DUF883 family membrane-anchored ribosome-binding protein
MSDRRKMEEARDRVAKVVDEADDALSKKDLPDKKRKRIEEAKGRAEDYLSDVEKKLDK